MYRRHDVTGSSPHVRGTADPFLLSVVSRRFIPARAGNSQPLRSPASRLPVHPRTCGEQNAMLFLIPYVNGSSPHVRGTAIVQQQEGPSFRFIPARAGNSFQTYPIKHRRTVHPRTCGEQSFPRGLDDKNYGSSPHVRGTDNALTDIIVISRFIPARAGNSNSLLLLIHSMAVHPRTCGEQSSPPTK